MSEERETLVRDRMERARETLVEADLMAQGGKSSASCTDARWRRFIAQHEAGDILTPDEEHAMETLIEAGERLTALKAVDT